MPKFTAKSYAALVKENILISGFHVTYIMENKTPSFCYSTGIYKSYGIPEIFISSLPQGLSSSLITSYVDSFKNKSPTINELIPANNLAPFDYYLILVKKKRLEDYVLASIKYYGAEPYDYFQLVFPDINMKFPHQEGYSYDQEIIGDYSPIDTNRQ